MGLSSGNPVWTNLTVFIQGGCAWHSKHSGALLTCVRLCKLMWEGVLWRGGLTEDWFLFLPRAWKMSYLSFWKGNFISSLKPTLSQRESSLRKLTMWGYSSKPSFCIAIVAYLLRWLKFQPFNFKVTEAAVTSLSGFHILFPVSCEFGYVIVILPLQIVILYLGS